MCPAVVNSLANNPCRLAANIFFTEADVWQKSFKQAAIYLSVFMSSVGSVYLAVISSSCSVHSHFNKILTANIHTKSLTLDFARSLSQVQNCLIINFTGQSFVRIRTKSNGHDEWHKTGQTVPAASGRRSLAKSINLGDLMTGGRRRH